MIAVGFGGETFVELAWMSRGGCSTLRGAVECLRSKSFWIGVVFVNIVVVSMGLLWEF